MTPEQAVKDYFAALSHHVPHYRRMWLLPGADRPHLLVLRFVRGIQGLLERQAPDDQG